MGHWRGRSSGAYGFPLPCAELSDPDPTHFVIRMMHGPRIARRGARGNADLYMRTSALRRPVWHPLSFRLDGVWMAMRRRTRAEAPRLCCSWACRKPREDHRRRYKSLLCGPAADLSPRGTSRRMAANAGFRRSRLAPARDKGRREELQLADFVCSPVRYARRRNDRIGEASAA